MGQIAALILCGAMIFFPLLYFVISAAVEEGTLRALQKYDNIKTQGNKRL